VKTIISLFILIPWSCFAFIETDLNFIYDKQIFGAKRNNFQISRTYNLNLAWYLTGRTALELGYGLGTIKTTENSIYEIDGSGLEIYGHENIVKNQYYSVGLRQSFAGRSALIRPMLSIGYSKQEITDQTTYKVRAIGSATGASLEQAADIMESDSVFATLALTLRVSQFFSIKSSVQTVFPAFDFDLAKDDLKYMAGIMWVF
jgi:hypothetical protein